MEERHIQLDGDHLLRTLQGAGLNPEKLNLKTVLPEASEVDVRELESRLRAAHEARAAGRWEVSVSVKFGNPRK